MGDNLLDGMSRAVENAWLVFMCVSEQYKSSRNCRKDMDEVQRGKLKPEDERVVVENYVFLKKELDVLDIINDLFSAKVLSDDDVEKIKAEKTRSEKADVFLKILLHAGPGKSYGIFLKSLEKGYKHILERLLPKASIPVNQNTRPASVGGSGSHIFISYCHADKSIVHRIYNSLMEKGYNLWIDENDMGLSLHDSMAEGVEKSWLVLMFISEKYMKSGNCKKEAEYADRRKKEQIFVKVQEKFDPDGWLGIMLGQKLYFDFCNSTTSYEKTLEKLIKAIERVKREKTQHP